MSFTPGSLYARRNSFSFARSVSCVGLRTGLEVLLKKQRIVRNGKRTPDDLAHRLVAMLTQYTGTSKFPPKSGNRVTLSIIIIIIIIIWHYNPLWVFAFSANSLPVLLSLAISFQFLTFNFFRSSITSTCHRCLGLPTSHAFPI